MFKKIVVGTMILGLIGILIAGAITRTNVKTGNTEARGLGRGRGNEMTTYATNGGQGQAGYPQDTLKGRGQGRSTQINSAQVKRKLSKD